MCKQYTYRFRTELQNKQNDFRQIFFYIYFDIIILYLFNKIYCGFHVTKICIDILPLYVIKIHCYSLFIKMVTVYLKDVDMDFISNIRQQ